MWRGRHRRCQPDTTRAGDRAPRDSLRQAWTCLSRAQPISRRSVASRLRRGARTTAAVAARRRAWAASVWRERVSEQPRKAKSRVRLDFWMIAPNSGNGLGLALSRRECEGLVSRRCVRMTPLDHSSEKETRRTTRACAPFADRRDKDLLQYPLRNAFSRSRPPWPLMQTMRAAGHRVGRRCRDRAFATTPTSRRRRSSSQPWRSRARSRGGNTTGRPRRRLSSALEQWQALYKERQADRLPPSYIIPALSAIGLGGASELDTAYTGYLSPTFKVGMRVPILYLRTTLGAAKDWVFDPDWDIERRCG